MKCFGLTDKGRVRKDNQDSFIIEKCEAKNCLIVGLCDGMGGAKAGGLASQLSNKAFVDFVYGKLTSRVVFVGAAGIRVKRSFLFSFLFHKFLIHLLLPAIFGDYLPIIPILVYY